MKNFSIIVATDQNNGIGINNTLPWQLKKDMAYFKNLTVGENNNTQNVVIMGRKTWESIPEKFRPLPGRLNLVLTRNEGYELPAPCRHFQSLDQALAWCEAEENKRTLGEVFVIGGGSIYKEAILHPGCEKIYKTEIQKSFDCDAFFPEIPEGFLLKEEGDLFFEGEIGFRFDCYEKR